MAHRAEAAKLRADCQVERRAAPSIRIVPRILEFRVHQDRGIALLLVAAIVVLFSTTVLHMMNPTAPPAPARTAASDPDLVRAGIPPDAMIEDPIDCTVTQDKNLVCR